MKPPLLLVASLLLNAALLAWLTRDRSRQAAPSGADGVVAASPASTPGAGPRDPETPLGAVAGGGWTDEVNWARLNTADWYAYRDGLRAWGCPERTLRDILEPAVRRHYGARMRAFAAPWVAGFWELARDPESFQRLEESVEPLKEEMEELLASLLGGKDDVPESVPGLHGEAESRLAFLPEDVRQQVWEIQVRHNRRWAELQQSPPSDTRPLAAAQRELEAQRDRELEAILSPEQLAEYRLRQSPHASVRDLAGIELSREEQGDIVAIQDRLAADPALRGNRAELARRSREELEKRLGPARFAEFERAGNPDFQSLTALADRTGVSQAQAVQFWEAREKIRREVESISGDASLSRAQREARLGALREALLQQAGESLGGADGREMWERQQRGWLEETFRLRRGNPFAGAPAR